LVRNKKSALAASKNKKHTMAPPASPIPLSPYEKDGQEYGLVPKYVLRRKAPILNANADGDELFSHVKNTQTDNGTPTKLMTPIKGLTLPLSPTPNSTLDSQSNDSQTMMLIKDCDDDKVRPQKTPQQVNALLQETDALLARRWRVANLVDSPAYESDKRLLLAQEGYNPSKAANRIEEHWKTKLELFGPDLVEKSILLMDVSKAEKTEVGVEDGYVQILPTRDLGGRAVIFFQYDPTLWQGKQKQLRRILFYMMASALQDDETVKRGMTLVVWNATPRSWFDPFWNAYSKIAAPYQVAKLHYCQQTQDIQYIVTERREKETDVRMHQGSLQECLHGLVVSYGIPSHFIPLTFDGRLDTKEHLKWVELRRRIESFPLPEQRRVVLVPVQSDVLLGKRRMSMNGNVIYHQMIASNMEAYYKDEEEGKRKIRLEIWTAITEGGGRFLLQIENSQIWEKLEVQSALIKISQAFDFLLAQYYITKDSGEGNESKPKKSSHEEDLFFGWVFDTKRCFNLIHCDGTGNKACW
jgi:hypothetical protein